MRLLISLCLIFFHCYFIFPGGQKIWGIPEEDFLLALKKHSHPVFKEEDTSSYPLRELDKLAPGAGFFLSFYQYKDNRLVYRLLEYEIERGQYMFALYSARRLMDLLIRDDLDKEAEIIGIRLRRLFPEDYILAKSLVASKYWQDKDVAADVDSLHEHFPHDAARDSELQLFYAVNSIRHNDPNWLTEVRRLLSDHETSEVHTRFAAFISLYGLGARIGQENMQLLNAKTALQDLQYIKSASLFLSVNPEDMTVSILSDIYTAVTSSRRFSDGVEYFDSVIALVDEPQAVKLYAQMYRGFLYRKKGQWKNALLDFEYAAENAPSSSIKQRMTWYIFNSLIHIYPESAYQKLTPYKKNIYDPSYFSDIFTEWVSDLLIQRNYKAIEELYTNVKETADPRVMSCVSYLIYRLEMEGIYNYSINKNELISYITHPDGDIYYRTLYARISGNLQRNPVVLEEKKIAEDEPLNRIVVRGFFEFGLEDMAYTYLYPYRNEMPASAVVELSRSLLDAGRPWESIRTAMWKSVSEQQALESLVYPQAFDTIIETEANNKHIPSWLLYSLIRAESFFNPSAVSHAGAVGLSQLMPETAKDVSRRLGLSGVDLTDATSNIAIGSWYLSHMLSRVDEPVDALMAYNAGLTRVRRWRKEWGDIPIDICVDLIPYKETRNYVKKIVRSSLVYGKLYRAATHNEIVEYLFPSLKSE